MSESLSTVFDFVCDIFNLLSSSDSAIRREFLQKLGFDETTIKLLLFLIVFIAVNLLFIKIFWGIHGERITQTISKSSASNLDRIDSSSSINSATLTDSVLGQSTEQ